MLYILCGAIIGLLNYFNLNFIFFGELLMLLIFVIRAILLKSKEKYYLAYIVPLVAFTIFLTTGFLQDSFYYSNTYKNLFKYMIIILEIIATYKCLRYNEEKFSKLIIGFFITGVIINYFQLYSKFNYIYFIHLFPVTLIFILLLNFIYKRKLNSLLPLIAIIMISFISSSRTNIFIGLVFIFIYILNKYISGNTTNRKNLIIKIFFIIVLITLIVLGYVYFSENVTIETASNNERMKLIDIAIEEYSRSPIIGVGIGNYNSYAQKVLNYNLRSNNLTTHNIYLELLAETGIIGFLLFISLYIMLGRKVIKLDNTNIKFLYSYLLVFYFFNTFNGINRFAFATVTAMLIYFIETNKSNRGEKFYE